jgi:hypothetical protein
MRPILYIILAAALSPLIAGCGDDTIVVPTADTTTVTFQDGISPSIAYYGTRDAMLKAGPDPDMNYGNFGDEPQDTLGVVRLGQGLYARRMIVRFDLTSVTSCAVLYSARLTIHIDPVDTNRAVDLYAYEATVPPAIPGSWKEGTGAEYSGVSWMTVDGTYPWTNPGGDVLDLMDERSVRADSAVVFDLSADRVKRWIDNPLTNHGVLVVTGIAIGEEYVIAHMRESTDIRLRPELTIKYRKAG